jgi:hypothetical protein
MSYDNIPREMRDFPHWINWRAEETADGKATKIPYQPRKISEMASVTDPSHWATFDEAVAMAKWSSGIGFVFHADLNPFTGIDLDGPSPAEVLAKQQEIYQALQSYSELSPSGHGLHIIVKGKVPRGVRFKNIEMYPHARFFTMTGNVYQMLRPVEERQYMLDGLFQEMTKLVNGHAIHYNGDTPETDNDMNIWERARTAQNGDRFLALWNGDWQNTIDARTSLPYTSQSEADFALINILSFYTQNYQQITRMFWASALGKRPKALRQDYLSGMIYRSFDRLPPPINLDLAHNKLHEAISAELTHVAKVAAPPASVTEATPFIAPPGLVGSIAHWVYQASPRPVPEIALAAALGLMSGLAGRAFNISGSGLNQYIMLVAPTGTGKEAMASGIDRLVQAAAQKVPAIMQYRGPAEIASGQAIIKFLEKQPSIISVIGEFGYKLRTLSDFHASSADTMLLRMLLDLYGKSGAGQVAHSMIYSDSAKNTTALYSPAFSLLCEGTPQSFYANISEKMVSDGLLPRFTVIEYLGQRVPLNEAGQRAQPSPQLVDHLTALVLKVNMLQQNRTVCNVEQTPHAQTFNREFDRFCDSQINQSDNDVSRQLWTRAYLKVLKLSAVVAVGIDYENPVIDLDTAKWAQAIIVHEIKAFMQRFEIGDIGSTSNSYGRNESEQVKNACDVIIKYLNADYVQLKAYRVDPDYHKDHIVTHSFMLQRLSRMAAYKQDRDDVSRAVTRAMGYLIEIGVIQQLNLNTTEFIARYGKRTGKVYYVTDYDKVKEIAGFNRNTRA